LLYVRLDATSPRQGPQLSLGNGIQFDFGAMRMAATSIEDGVCRIK